MDTELAKIREQQRETWDKFSPGWKKWDDFTMNFLLPMGQEIIRALNVKSSDHILDVATGTGEPGLTLASMVPKGKVIGQDLSEGMLKIAKANALQKGIRNYETVSCDISELPFPDNFFDAVSCRMGFMFFPDMEKAAAEMVRALKPGGRIATSVWGAPPRNIWITALTSTIGKRIETPAPPSGAPGMFRCAQPGFMAGLLRNAGLKNVSETEVNSSVDYPSIDYYWQMMNEVAAPVVAVMSKADAGTKMKIKSDLDQLLREKVSANGLTLPFSAIVIRGDK